ncbi:hypothetical protein PGO_003820 [Plasmodium gonderi]|uniref:Variable surface protein n=1 Tax=Plasmodium gonderi TaxID=77519 RepID=A0A1Y1JW59_PLAGO|nr:hypothetical protein PGO_003820 [Plasmodium gonderi]GAW84583.1 hypothetical protein PGO_003820 [Plasmodium gonderi]
MKKKIENCKKLSEKCNRRTRQSVYIKRAILFIHNIDICLKTSIKWKKHNNYSIYAMLYKLFNISLNISYNVRLQKCVKLIGIYQLFIIRFIVAMEKQQQSDELFPQTYLKLNESSANQEVLKLLDLINVKLIPFCRHIIPCEYCKKYYIATVISIVTFIFVILFFQYICIKLNCNSFKGKNMI